MAHRSANMMAIFTGFIAFALFCYLLYAYSDTAVFCLLPLAEKTGIGYFIELVLHTVFLVPYYAFGGAPPDFCEVMITKDKNLGLIWAIWIIIGLFSIFFDRLLRNQVR
jgi:hypothetical protein